jgi:hypothetical protein
MWWSFVISAITIPILFLFDHREITDNDLVTIDNLILSENSYYDSGGGKGSTPSIKFKFTNTKRDFLINSNEYHCVSKGTILENFKKGSRVSIKIDKTDKDKFFKANWFIRLTKLYGISINGKEFIPLNCRNQVSMKRNNAAIMASTVSAILSLIIAIFILKPKTKYQALGQLPVDPVFIVLGVWVIVYLMLR